MEENFDAIHRQQTAFAFLKSQACEAHLEGNGLRVATFCKAALQEIENLVKENKYALPLREVLWVFVFQGYWLMDRHDLVLAHQNLAKIPKGTEDDQSVFKILDCYNYLLLEPLDTGPKPFQLLNEIDPHGFGKNPEVATTELVKHLIELTWFRSVENKRWIKVIDSWAQTGFDWVNGAIIGLKQRLQIQSKLTNPTDKIRRIETAKAELLREISPLAELWLLHLHYESALVRQKIESLAINASSDPFKWRQIADYWKTNSDSKTPDGVGVWLARRRSMSLEFPILAFHDQREFRISELQKRLFREARSGSAGVRFEIWQLAMLHELAALRLWDYWMWRDAIEAQSEVFLEAAQWPDCEIGAGIGAFELAVRAGTARQGKDDTFIRNAESVFEFSKENERIRFFGALLNTYPRQYYSALELLIDLGDFIPETLWGEVASWTDSVSKHQREKQLGGWHLNPISHFNTLFCLIPNDSPVWNILMDDILFLVQMPHAWRGGKLARTISEWLTWCPEPLAKEIIGELIGVEASDLAERLARINLLIELDHSRGIVQDSVVKELTATATHPAEIERINCEFNGVSNLEDLEELKKGVVTGIRDALKLASPDDPEEGFSFGPFPAGVDRIRNWDVDDLPLVETLIQTAYSKNAWKEWVSWIINTLQLIAAHSSVELLKKIKGTVKPLIKCPPEGRDPHPKGGPFSVFQYSGTSSGEILESLGWLSFQFVRVLKTKGHDFFFDWVDFALKSRQAEPLAIAFYGCLIIGGQSKVKRDRALQLCEIIISILLASKDMEGRKVSTLVALLKYLESILCNQKLDFVNWKSEDGQAFQENLIGLWERLSSQLCEDDDGRIRAAAASILYNLNKNGLIGSEDLIRLEVLSRDARASVRFASVGGHKEEVERRYGIKKVHNGETESL